MAGLKSATSYVRGEIGRRVRLRRTPEITFLEDRSIERGTQVLSLINRLSQERKPDAEDSENLSESLSESLVEGSPDVEPT
jgi:ribosome-binding factor A